PLRLRACLRGLPLLRYLSSAGGLYSRASRWQPFRPNNADRTCFIPRSARAKHARRGRGAGTPPIACGQGIDTEERDEDPRDLWGRGAGAPRSLLSLLGPPCTCRRSGRRSAAVYAGPSGCQTRWCQAAYTSRPRLTVRTGRMPSSETTSSGSTSYTAKSACLPGSRLPFLDA